MTSALGAVSALAGCVLWALAALPTGQVVGSGPAFWGAVVLWFAAPILAVAGIWRHGAVMSDFMRRYQRQEIYNAIDAITTDHELQTIIRLNQARMDAYHELTLTQAARAYRNTQVAMAVGFVVLAAGAVAVLTVHAGTASKTVVGALATAGTALSGYIVATFLRSEHQALGQLNVYFRQPLTTSYLLTAERWALKLPADARPGILARMADEVVAQAFGSAGTGPNPPASVPSPERLPAPEPGWPRALDRAAASAAAAVTAAFGEPAGDGHGRLLEPQPR